MINLETFQAAPGSYNVSQDLSTRSQVFNNPPRPVIPKGKKYPSMFISNELAKEYQGFDSPPVSKYSPNATVLFKSSSMPKFGGEQRKDYFLMGRDRSPGPIYLYTERNKRACSFGIGEKGSTINQPSHSSGNYEPQSINKRLPIKMKGYVSDKLYLKNLENTYKGKLGPGPAMYKNSGSFTRGVRLPKAIRLQPLINDNPGPGTYSSLPAPVTKKTHGFGGSKKNLDIRACNLYSVSNSHEFFR